MHTMLAGALSRVRSIGVHVDVYNNVYLHVMGGKRSTLIYYSVDIHLASFEDCIKMYFVLSEGAEFDGAHEIASYMLYSPLECTGHCQCNVKQTSLSNFQS